MDFDELADFFIIQLIDTPGYYSILLNQGGKTFEVLKLISDCTIFFNKLKKEYKDAEQIKKDKIE